MTQRRRTALKELQELDQDLLDAKEGIQDYDTKFEAVENPALVLESETVRTRSRVQEMKLEERRLELSLEEKKTRQERLDERLGSVKNLREEAAVSAELEMVKRALQSDEQEAFSLLDQIRTLEDKLADLEVRYAEAKGLVEPALAALIAERDAGKAAVAALVAQRESFVAGMDPVELKLYEGIRRGGRRKAVAELTLDGACANCFGVIPLQLQNEIRHGNGLHRCEACGVILAAPDPDAAEAEAAAEAAKLATAAAVVADQANGDEAGTADDGEAEEE